VQPDQALLGIEIGRQECQAAQILGVDKTTIYRWLRDGFLTGEQLTPGVPWQIRITRALRGKIRPDVPDGWLPLD
jgi:excisionase family DNA binding protein